MRLLTPPAGVASASSPANAPPSVDSTSRNPVPMSQQTPHIIRRGTPAMRRTPSSPRALWSAAPRPLQQRLCIRLRPRHLLVEAAHGVKHIARNSPQPAIAAAQPHAPGTSPPPCRYARPRAHPSTPSAAALVQPQRDQRRESAPRSTYRRQHIHASETRSAPTADRRHQQAQRIAAFHSTWRGRGGGRVPVVGSPSAPGCGSPPVSTD